MRFRNIVTVTALIGGALTLAVSSPALAVLPDGLAYERTSRNTVADSYGVAIGDVTENGRADLVVTTHASPDQPARAYAVLVFAQQLNGTLAGAPTVHPISVAAPTAASLLAPAIGDLDDDGDLDLAVGHEEGIDVFAQAAGTFGAPSTLAQANPVHEIEAADLNGDGRDDLVYTITNPSSGFRYLRRLQKADGTTGAAVSLGYADSGSFAVGDVTGDGKPDVIVEGAGSGTVFVHNDADEGFTETTDARLAGVVAATVADVNGDTFDDLLVATATQPAILAGQDGTAVADPVALGDLFPNVVSMQAADLDEDGTLDLAIMGEDGTRVLLQDDGGNLDALACSAASVVPDAVGGDETLALGDLNGDGRPEIVGAQEDPVVRRLSSRLPGASIASTVETEPAPSPIELDESTTIEGWVVTPGGRCGDPEGQVHLERTLPGGAPQIVATEDLSGGRIDGQMAAFSFEDEPSAVGEVSYRVLWDGDAFHAAAEGDPVTVDVTKRSSSLALDASDATIVAGTSTTLTATLTGGDRPASVSFSKIVDGVRKPVGNDDVGGADKASVTVSPITTTTYVATYAATDTAKGATSNTVKVTVSKRKSSLTLNAPTKISFGKTATLVADLTGGADRAKVAFYKINDGDEVLLGRVTANAKGKASFDVKPVKHTKYVARFAGDVTWTASKSPTRIVKVKVVTTGKMVHFGHKKNGVAFYVCCRAYFAFEVAPNHAGERVLVESEYLSGHTWKSFDGSSDHFRLRKNSTQEIFTDISGGEPFLFRIRACMDDDADHLGDCSAWVRFRFE